ncbi:MAG TPA: hypothetical protein VFB62_14840, partial [Polyangiaceae bacterium]|nr:hypothetical protein [Polyangiaceae bacterium]
PPFLPRDRQMAADVYWAAKRLAALPVGTIAEAIAAGELEAGAQHWLYQALHLRRASIIARGFDVTTPCEAVTLLPRTGKAPARLLLVDLAVDEGFIRHRKIRYRVRYYDAAGREISDERRVKPRGANVVVPLPSPLASHEYVVVRVLALRNQVALPRPFEIHLKPTARGAFRLLAVRH